MGGASRLRPRGERPWARAGRPVGAAERHSCGTGSMVRVCARTQRSLVAQARTCAPGGSGCEAEDGKGLGRLEEGCPSLWRALCVQLQAPEARTRHWDLGKYHRGRRCHGLKCVNLKMKGRGKRNDNSTPTGQAGEGPRQGPPPAHSPGRWAESPAPPRNCTQSHARREEALPQPHSKASTRRRRNSGADEVAERRPQRLVGPRCAAQAQALTWRSLHLLAPSAPSPMCLRQSHSPAVILTVGLATLTSDPPPTAAPHLLRLP